MGETWRVVLASGEAREVVVCAFEGGKWFAVWCGNETLLHPSPMIALHAMLVAFMDEELDVREILAPGEPTRAELAAQLAAVTAERDEMAARRDDALADYAAVAEYLGGIVRAWQRASDDDRRMADTFVSRLRREIEEARDSGRGEWWEVCRGKNPAPLRTELAVLREQQAPLVACVDALRAAARDAGWRDADATGESLVAWVRRGEREACARIADDMAAWAAEHSWGSGRAAGASEIARRIREGGE